MTYAELKSALDKLTPEQLEKPALWCGDDRGGEIESLGFTEEDTYRDDGDTGELFTSTDFHEACLVDGGQDRFDFGKLTLPAGSPMLFTDGVA